jgi:dipeptidyl aminopeptidase/acylaminoacyl peptidase
MTKTLPFGTWPSPITPESIVADAATPTATWFDGDVVWWSEARPSEGGRIQIVRNDPDGPVDILPDGFNARTRVHEYGGGAWWVDEGVLFFANWDDQRLYRVDPGTGPRPITPEPPIANGWRYADGRRVPGSDWIVCVREDHTGGGEATNEIVMVRADGSASPTVIVEGRDFVSSPRPSPDGARLAWIAWDHPNLPWNDTELWVADIDTDGPEPFIAGATRLAGSAESLMQPVWRGDELFVISDRSNWWNVYRIDGVDDLVPVAPMHREVGGPAWVFDLADYGVTPRGEFVICSTVDGSAAITCIDPDGSIRTWTLDRSGLASVRVGDGTIVAVATSGHTEPEVVSVDLAQGTAAVLRPARDLGLDSALISRPRSITFPSRDGREAHAYFYVPTNPAANAPAGELPPLIVMSHGGPTSAARPGFNLAVQYWTSRGFAVADVDYGGSTGFGRDYRYLLEGRWGIVDVEDCCAAADHLAAQGLVDRNRMAIRGGSAGGYTTLAALAFTDTFAAGANHYGVSDIAALMADTHKFESRYDDFLIGPMPASVALMAERSPIHHVDGFSCPLITFQGLEDAVVPPSQSEQIVAALDRRGIPHAYVAFEGEQHGFRRAETIMAVLDAELSFYGQVFGFDPPGITRPVTLAHADALGAPGQG